MPLNITLSNDAFKFTKGLIEMHIDHMDYDPDFDSQLILDEVAICFKLVTQEELNVIDLRYVNDRD